MIGECLEHLERSAAACGVTAEIVVADTTGEATIQEIRTRFPSVIVLPVAGRRSIPELRADALKQCKGEIVAVIEDHCNVTPDWFHTILVTHEENPSCIAVGGAVENGSREHLTDWAVYFCEYSEFMPPLARGVSDAITGNNVSYKRTAFQGWDDLEFLRSGFWETTLHPRLRERGERFFMEPAILVHHKKRFPFGYFASQRFAYSRYYASLVTARLGTVGRIVRGIASLALPPILLYRIGSRVRNKGGHDRELLRTLPLLSAFTVIWAVGEAAGCFFGQGDSMEVIE